jgi:hypothetical protein
MVLEEEGGVPLRTALAAGGLVAHLGAMREETRGEFLPRLRRFARPKNRRRFRRLFGAPKVGPREGVR